MREYGTGLYSAGVYYLSKTIVEVVNHDTVILILFQPIKSTSVNQNRKSDTILVAVQVCG